MLLIGFTRPELFSGEERQIESLLRGGFRYVHIRKPEASEQEIARLIESISPEFHPRLKIHDCFSLMQRFNLAGVHLNSRNPAAPDLPCLLSRSCHSVEEMDRELAKGIYEYVTLSPIFDSISKPGYRSAFSLSELTNHVRGKNVIALGGVTRERLPELQEAGFYGAAMLGGLLSMH